ncbi:cyclic GMP-AMP synthase [Anolis sagrei]|uniref:cyclic GMP-AMP synthase n=1 Tax=Anolis sagrei TaxID=38937 RepID=UPI00352290E6
MKAFNNTSRGENLWAVRNGESGSPKDREGRSLPLLALPSSRLAGESGEAQSGGVCCIAGGNALPKRKAELLTYGFVSREAKPQLTRIPAPSEAFRSRWAPASRPRALIFLAGSEAMEPGAAGRRRKSGMKEEEKEEEKERKAAPTERAAGAPKGATQGPKGRKQGEGQKEKKGGGKEKGMEKSGKKEKEEEAAPMERAAKGATQGPKGRKGSEGQKKGSIGGGEEKGMEKKKKEEAAPTGRTAKGAPEGLKRRKGGEEQKKGMEKSGKKEGEGAPTERAVKGAPEGPKRGKGGESQKEKGGGEEKGMEKSGKEEEEEEEEEEAAQTGRAAKGATEGPKGRKRGEGQEKSGMEKSGKEKGEEAAPTERAAKGATQGPKGRKGGESQKEKKGGVGGMEEKGMEKEEVTAAPTARDAEGPKGRKGGEGSKEKVGGGEEEEKAPEKKRPSRAKDEGEAASRAEAPPAPPWALLPVLRRVLERLRLSKEARSEAAEQVNRLRDRLLSAVRKAPCFKAVEFFSSGSYYERVKICSPDEFDIMFKIPKVRLELEPCEVVTSSGAFYYVKLKRDPANKELNQFCDDNEQLSSSRMLLKLRNIIIDEVKKMADMNISVEKKRPGCPAVTVLIGSPPSVISVDIILSLEFHHPKWCSSTENGMGIEEWMGTKVKKSLRSEPLYLVPKNVKDGKCFIDNTWRLSFSNIEKMLLQNHGQTKTCCEIKGEKCCRKDCLKLLKYLLWQLKTKHENRNQFEKFCSYHVKTAFFHACVKWPKDSNWLLANLDECFNRLLNYFLDCLKEAKLPLFFIPEFNFFSEERIDRTKRNALVKTIEKEINNRFPMFN